MEKIAVFCGSSYGDSPVFQAAAKQLGELLANKQIALVYGGASVGLMGDLADSVLEHGGYVIGVMPQDLVDREIAHPSIHELHTVSSMHERKERMSSLADGFVALPGGPGTLEEFMEVFTWAQLGFHQKPCGLLNIDHYYSGFVDFMYHMNDRAFLQDRYRQMAIVEENPTMLLDRFHTYQAPAIKTY